jgi:diguanylate cyclase (GGDEF)-like protein
MPWSEAIRTGEMLIHTDLTTLDPAMQEEARSQGFEACWVFPVRQPSTHEVTACLIAWRTRPGGPSPGERVAGDRMGRLLSLALERRRAQGLLLHAARHDALTGLPNRSQFFRHLGRELHRDGHLVAVLYLDLDGFKPVNDRYGHRAGDHVLGQIARRIEGVLRPRDLTARLGGDEFGVLCTQLRDEAEAIAIAERLIAAVAEPMVLPDETIRSPELAAMAGTPIIDVTGRDEPVVVSVTVSVGIAFGHQSGTDDERLVELADAAMYQAKASGHGSWFRSSGYWASGTV